MKINILLPYKEKFDENEAASVSITVKNNLLHSKYLDDIRIYGQSVKNPLFRNNFIGLKYSIFSLKSKNNFLAHKMLKIILNDSDKRQLIEIHNRPYLVDKISKVDKFPISLFFHNDPQTMKGSKSIKERENILEKCVAVFCVSKYIKNLFLEGVLKNKEKVHVLYNGVEINKKKLPNKKKEILFVGRLVPEKGVHIYVEVIKIIAKKYPKWNFGLIGSFRLGNNESKNQYAEEVIKKFNIIGPQAKYYGFKDQRFVEKKMQEASIIIIPSLWQEPFGLVAAEAMSNGMAVIASRVGGIPEIIGENGVLINDLNHKKLEKEISKLIEKKSILEKFQNKSRKNYEFDSKRISNKLDLHRAKIMKNFL